MKSRMEITYSSFLRCMADDMGHDCSQWLRCSQRRHYFIAIPGIGGGLKQHHGFDVRVLHHSPVFGGLN